MKRRNTYSDRATNSPEQCVVVQGGLPSVIFQVALRSAG